MQEVQVQQLNRLFASEQPELRKIAAALKRVDLSVTLNVTALVNEAYVELRDSQSEFETETQLKQRAARAMRNVLADAARSRAAQKRGGDIQFVAWDDSHASLVNNDRELLALDDALTELASLDQAQADLVQWHFFGGLSWAEVAAFRGVSLATVEREWRVVRAWLTHKLGNCP